MKALPCLLALCMGCSSQQPLPNLQSASMSFPSPVVMELQPGPLPVVLVRFAGASEEAATGVPILVDTGAELTTLSRASAVQLGLSVRPYAGESEMFGSGGTSIPITHYASIPTLQLGALEIQDFHVPVVDSPVFGRSDIIGLIGQDLLAKLTTIIDMESRKLHFVPSSGDQEEVSAYLQESQISAGDWTALKIEYIPLPHMYSQPRDTAGAETSPILIDSGAVGTSLPEQQCVAMGLVPDGKTVHEGVDKVYEETTYGAQTIYLFGFKCTLDITGRNDEAGILGMNFFSQFVMVLEGPAKRLWLHHRTVVPAELIPEED